MVKATTGQTVHYIADVNDVPQIVKQILQPDDLVITMGAGSISQYGPKLLAALEEE